MLPMRLTTLIIFLSITYITAGQQVYIDQNGFDISKKEFRKLKRKGSDSLIAISSYDGIYNELFLRRKSVNIKDSKKEIASINLITDNEFDVDQPLLILYYPSIEEATLSRDELLQSIHWYTTQYSIVLRDIQNNLGNILIVAAPNFNNISLPGIYNDDLNFFNLPYFDSTVKTPQFLWISKENSFIEPIDFIQNYAVLITRSFITVSNEVNSDNIVTVDKTFKKVEKATMEKPISRVELLKIDNSKLFKIIYEDDTERKLDTVIRNGYADYFSELTGENIKRNDTIIVDFHIYTSNYRSFKSELQRRRKLQKEIDKKDSMKLVWIAQAGSLYLPDGCVYDNKDLIRKKLATYGPTDGNHFILYPNGRLLTLPDYHDDYIDLSKLKKDKEHFKNKELEKMPYTLLIAKKQLPPPKVLNPAE